MNLPPLVERELRLGARRGGFFWARGALALAAGVQGYEMLGRMPLGAARTGAVRALTGADLLSSMSVLVFSGALLMGLLCADSISRERREGTLGLLLLTDQSPAQIVQGKLLSRGLLSMLIVLGSLPALMLPVLAGGVTGAQAVMTGLGILNSVFVSLAAGLWMSAHFKQRRNTLLATLGLLAALLIGPDIIGGSILGAGALPFLRLLSLRGWIAIAAGDHTPLVLPIPLPRFGHYGGAVFGLTLPWSFRFISWFAVTHALGWIFLRQAKSALASNWQDEPAQHFRELKPVPDWAPRPNAEAGTPPPLARPSWPTDPRPWNDDPVRWRVQRLGTASGLIWLAVICDLFAQLGLTGKVFDLGTAPGETWGFFSFAGSVIILFSSALVAVAGARFFQDTRRQQDLELLLTTPVGRATILSGQRQVLSRALAWPVGLVLLLALPSGCSVIGSAAVGRLKDVWYYLTPFLITLNLVAEIQALCWAGMWFGLRGRNTLSVVAQSLGLVQLAPLALALGLVRVLTWWTGDGSYLIISGEEVPAVLAALALFLAKNIALIGWARFRLRRELRLGLGSSEGQFRSAR